MAKYIIVNNETGIAENIIAYEEGVVWQPPEGFSAYPAVGKEGVGWTYSNGEWISPFPLPDPDLSDE